MPTDFPGGVDDIQNDVTNSTVLTDLHPSLHNDLADAIMAIETQVLAGGGVADGSITSAKIADGTIQAIDLADGAVTSAKILDGTIATGDLADGAVTSAKIADGTIATADLANQAVTNAKLANDTARANLLTNGGFEVWQRGNGPFTAGSTYGPDRWQLFPTAGTLSVSRDTANADTGSLACAACTNTNTVVGSCFLQNNMPNTDGQQLKSRTLSASVRVRTSTANAVRVGLAGDGTGAATAYSAYHSGSGTYTTLTATYAAPADATFVVFRVYFDASCTAYIDNAMLVVGSVAADYAPLHPADDLARCQRYYEPRYINIGVASPGQAINPGAVVGHLQYLTKAVTPTITFTGSFKVSQANGTQVACTSGTSSVTTNNAELDLTGATGLVAGNASICFGGAAGATIVMEANP